MINIDSLDFEKVNGLMPAIIQDANNFQVLMLGYMNKEALQKTLKEERVTFFSRTKQRLWTKGETSGNYLDVVDIQQDCDDDTLLILAKPHGPTCHTGEQSCFYRKDFKPTKNLNFLNDLEELIISRKKEMPEGSYTTSLFTDGIDKIAQKVGEEAVETVIEAKNENHSLVDEVSDLIYHLLVLLVEKGVPLQSVVKNLEERHDK
ncbi:bifunctional phosphoribosyl-AMP cyclohydrolase/phosphoribosyl-ATP diphosphatase HisIE [Fodinibius sp.]|uniref:bifunctional phosphoribosyl-AMP cyclohydrolase/phosphoribosyl-ATP diphosphatase HisIE n=1 Tax=Fodinibius sp. TaxID=1872440 RepID=UPI002ACD8A24|nr:bifunctional phosphoribosyl-AMP cyclohydrolase/phosphoribosyl-ATP diphosphatase HisIE [Fodinibius sp.]MDZ7657948.1 bifunctional phosphoribosyl-AMP cyclohydrolase/phosphoribosyl-ATP diphosphatase HisIE [Fodinibius sp.]